jgi:hypothetical protein
MSHLQNQPETEPSSATSGIEAQYSRNDLRACITGVLQANGKDLERLSINDLGAIDKRRLYNEARRVLKDGGRLAIWDIIAGPRQPIHFPVPWADAPDISFLAQSEELREILAEARFPVCYGSSVNAVVWRGRTTEKWRRSIVITVVTASRSAIATTDASTAPSGMSA